MSAKPKLFRRSTLRARVTGFLVEKAFNEGEDVKKDDVLYHIDPAEFEAAVAAATAGVERAQAAFTEADQKLERTRTLADKGTLSQANLDEATAAQGAPKPICRQHRPTSSPPNSISATRRSTHRSTGASAASAVDVGNLIGPDSGVLATVIDLDPIRVSFSVSERIFLNVTEMMEAGDLPDLVPRIRLATGELFDESGKIAFADNQVDPNTGTVRVFVDFPNPKQTLVPGLFVHVVLTSAEPEERILIPQAAVQLNQTGPFVLVVGSDNRVEIRQIKTGDVNGADIVVDEGLSVGEQIHRRRHSEGPAGR